MAAQTTIDSSISIHNLLRMKNNAKTLQTMKVSTGLNSLKGGVSRVSGNPGLWMWSVDLTPDLKRWYYTLILIFFYSEVPIE